MDVMSGLSRGDDIIRRRTPGHFISQENQHVTNMQEEREEVGVKGSRRDETVISCCMKA